MIMNYLWENVVDIKFYRDISMWKKLKKKNKHRKPINVQLKDDMVKGHNRGRKKTELVTKW